MMMSVGSKIGITSNPLETAPMDGVAGASGTGDIFLQMLAGMGTPLTAESGGEAPLELSCGVDGQENLTIKTFQKLLGVNSGETEPSLAPGEDELTKGDAETLAENTEAAAILSLQVAVPAPFAPPVIGGALAPAATKSAAEGAPAAVKSVPDATPAAAALLAAAMATSPAAALIVSGKAVAAEGPASDVPAGGAVAPSFAKSGLDFKVPLATQSDTSVPGEALKLPTRMASGEGAQPILAEAAAPAEGSSAEARPVQANGIGPTLTGIFSAALQPAAGQSVSMEATPTAAQPGEIVDPALEQQLDLAHEGEWLDRLARDIARTAGAEGALRFRLNPENLGSLHVELTQGQAGASLRLTADTEAARAIIADAQPRLVAEARAQGVRIAETHVDLGTGGHSAPGEQRRQDAERPEDFVRTSRSLGAAQESNDAQPAVNASERYA